MSETNDAKETAMPEEREAAMDARELAQVTGETPPVCKRTPRQATSIAHRFP